MLNLNQNKQQKEEFQEKVLENMNSLYNLGYRLSNNREEANDLVQEACLRGYRFYHRFEKGTNFKAWILTILRNIFINKYRKRVREPGKVSYEEIEGSFEDMVALDMTGADEEIFGEAVQTSIDKLPEELKTVVTLFYVEELSYKEIAEVMNCPMGTVMSRLHMARKILRKSLVHKVKKEGLA